MMVSERSEHSRASYGRKMWKKIIEKSKSVQLRFGAHSINPVPHCRDTDRERIQNQIVLWMRASPDPRSHSGCIEYTVQCVESRRVRRHFPNVYNLTILNHPFRRVAGLSETPHLETLWAHYGGLGAKIAGMGLKNKFSLGFVCVKTHFIFTDTLSISSGCPWLWSHNSTSSGKVRSSCDTFWKDLNLIFLTNQKLLSNSSAWKSCVQNTKKVS